MQRGWLCFSNALESPGSFVVSVDGSEKGGVNFVSAGCRTRYSILGHSQYAIHPFAIAQIKEKDPELKNLPLQVFLMQSGCDRMVLTVFSV